MGTRIAITIMAAITLSGCNPATPKEKIESSDKPPTSNSLADLQASHHNYAERDGDLYMYITAVSDEEKAKGRATGDVLIYRYQGREGRVHILNQVDDGGDLVARLECTEPCRIIKMKVGSEISRIPHNSDSVVGSAFDDAINGNLEPAKPTKKAQVTEGTPSGTIPAAFVGEWNDVPADCGTGNNDSALSITPTGMRFYESSGTVKSVEVRESRAATVTLAMTGEGESWTTTLQLQVSASGDAITIDGSSRRRCP